MSTSLDASTTYTFDNIDRLIQVTQPDPDGTGSQTAPVSNYTYDANGNRVTETNPLGKVTTWTFDKLNRMTQITEPDPDGSGSLTSPITTFVYDAGSRRTSLTDPDSNVTSWAYDGLNRVTTETNALSKAESFGYNAAGDLTSRTDRNGRVTNYGYDNLHRRTQEQWMSGSTVLNTFGYTFDAGSQLTSASATDTQMTYTFDNLGRVLTASNSGTTNIPTTVQTNVYDANSRRTQQTATVASVADYKNTWTWDNANRQTQVKQESQTGGISVAEKRVDFTYNTGGLFTGVKRYNDLAGTQIVANTTYTYDLLARLTALDHKNASGGNLANYTWTFDSDRRITNFTNIDGYSNYTYDTNDQVTVVDHSYQTDESYTYDANGNRTNTGYTTSTNNRVTSDGTYNYAYDDEGNRISRTKISDSTKVEYTWDHRNRLTDVVFKTSGGTVTKKVQYQYDVFDRRIGKKIDADGNGTYESATYWVYDDAGKRDPNTGTALDDIVLEFTDADGDGSGLATLTTRYLHGPGIDQILASEATSGNVVTWALADHQGTVRDMVRYASGTTTVVNHRKFDAFGNLTAESDATVKFLYSYTGREWDGDAGLYYYRARWYDAKIGRFISEDPMGFAAGDANISRYVGNSMPNAMDPTGMANKLVEIGIKGMSFYIEWFPELNTGELKILTRKGAELGVVKMFLNPTTKEITAKIVETHGTGGKILPGVASSVMRKINERLAAELAKNAERLGGAWVLTRLSDPLAAAGRIGLGRPKPSGGSMTGGTIFAWLSLQGIADAHEVPAVWLDPLPLSTKLYIDPSSLGLLTDAHLAELLGQHGYSPSEVEHHMTGPDFSGLYPPDYRPPNINQPTPLPQFNDPAFMNTLYENRSGEGF